MPVFGPLTLPLPPGAHTGHRGRAPWPCTADPVRVRSRGRGPCKDGAATGVCHLFRKNFCIYEPAALVEGSEGPPFQLGYNTRQSG